VRGHILNGISTISCGEKEREILEAFMISKLILYKPPLGSKAFQQEVYCNLSCSIISLSDNMDGKRLEYKGEEALKEIERLTEKADEVQKKILKEILTRNRETEYLSKYMKGSKDILDFKLNVPVITYMGIRPFIQRIANGEDSSLISGHPITEMLSRSLSLSLCLSLCEVCFWVFYIYIYIFFFLFCLFLS